MLCVFCPVCHILFSVFPSVLQRHLRLHIFLFVSDQFTFRPSSLSELVLSHMIPPEKITDTQIGVATWLFLWCTVLGSVGSFALVWLNQQTWWYSPIPYIGTRTSSLSHAHMRPVRKRKNPQIALRNRETRRQMSDVKTCRYGNLSKWGLFSVTFRAEICLRKPKPTTPPATLRRMDIT